MPQLHRSLILLLDPNISQTKCQKNINNNARLKSSIELALGKKKRKCNSYRKLKPDKKRENISWKKFEVGSI